MKRDLLFVVLLILPCLISAQTLADFESFDMPQDTFLNGSDGSGGFVDGNIFLPNNYNNEFMSWSGWSISNKTDTITKGFNNQYSCISGAGVDGSENYAVTFVSGESTINFQNEALSGLAEGFYINNSTYAYYSLLEGDGFAKKFGGETGDDPDFYKLTIKKYRRGAVAQYDSIEFYLADYRFEDNSMDYIVKDWTYVPLGSLNNIDSLSLTLSSTDNGQFGMNTPAYFCIDNFTTMDVGVTSTLDILGESLTLFPNPATDYISIQSEQKLDNVEILNNQGLLIDRVALDDNNRINISHLEPGIYIVRAQAEGQKFTSKFIKY